MRRWGARLSVIGPIAVVVGLVIIFLAALADPLGIGNEGPNDFGGKQIAGVIVGIVVTIAGVWITMKTRGPQSDGEPQAADPPSQETPTD